MSEEVLGTGDKERRVKERSVKERSVKERSVKERSVIVVGLGPAGPELTSDAARRCLREAEIAFLRTNRHPSAAPFSDVPTFDHHYEEADSFEEVYRRIVEDLVSAASGGAEVVYAVPGSALVAERTVELLRLDKRVKVSVLPALSFLDLAWDRLGVDPLALGVRLVDGERFAAHGAGERGPLLVCQCWSPEVLSNIKLARDEIDSAGSAEVTLLHHLGLSDERIVSLPWDELDRSFTPDHLTSLWIPELAAPVDREMADLIELVQTLRLRCPWDREQTHASLTKHLLEETYEVLDAIDELTEARRADSDPSSAFSHLEEELGDLLFQVVFHSRLGAEEGRFTLADVARGVREKLVSRHPHVFGDVTATTPEAVVSNWETIKQAEKGRSSVTDGIPTALPSLALASKIQRKSRVIDPVPADFEASRRWLSEAVGSLTSPSADLGPREIRDYDAQNDNAQLGSMLYVLADLCGQLGINPEEALRTTSLRHRDQIVQAEQERATQGKRSPDRVPPAGSL